MLVGTYGDYDQFKAAVQVIAPRPKDRVVLFGQGPVNSFNVGLDVLGTETGLLLSVPTQPSTFATDFPDAIAAGFVLLQ